MRPCNRAGPAHGRADPVTLATFGRVAKSPYAKPPQSRNRKSCQRAYPRSRPALNAWPFRAAPNLSAILSRTLAAHAATEHPFFFQPERMRR